MVLSLGQFLIGLSKPLDWIVVLGSISVEEEAEGWNRCRFDDASRIRVGTCAWSVIVVASHFGTSHPSAS